jgi:plastocyanin
MNLKRTLTIAATVFVVLATSALAAPPRSSSLVIRHQLRGCHAWALKGGAFKATQALTLSARGTVTITNNDVMPHTLVQLAGPAARLYSPAMTHIGAVSKVTFARIGVYVFGTKAGEDYMKGVKTIGEDNVLRLVVTVR